MVTVRVRPVAFEDQKFLAVLLRVVDLNFEFERESLLASLNRLRIQRTLVASEDSNLEVKKKSP
jgi:hypothetical protein